MGAEPAAGVVEKQFLCGSEYTVGNNKFPENVLCYRGSAGSDNVDIGLRQTQDFQGGLRAVDPCGLQLRFLGPDASPELGWSDCLRTVKGDEYESSCCPPIWRS